MEMCFEAKPLGMQSLLWTMFCLVDMLQHIVYLSIKGIYPYGFKFILVRLYSETLTRKSRQACFVDMLGYWTLCCVLYYAALLQLYTRWNLCQRVQSLDVIQGERHWISFSSRNPAFADYFHFDCKLRHL